MCERFWTLPTSVDAVAAVTGFHTFVIYASNTPEANRRPRYELNVSYQAPQR